MMAFIVDDLKAWERRNLMELDSECQAVMSKRS